MLSVNQGGIKYYFFSIWYDSTWDWTTVSRNIREHSTDEANNSVLHKYAVWMPKQFDFKQFSK